MLSFQRRRFLSLLVTGVTLLTGPLFLQQPAQAHKASFSGTFTAQDGEGNPTGETGAVSIRIKRERKRRGVHFVFGTGQFGDSASLILRGVIPAKDQPISLVLSPRRIRRGQRFRSYTFTLTEGASGDTLRGEYTSFEVFPGRNPAPEVVGQGTVTLQEQ